MNYQELVIEDLQRMNCAESKLGTVRSFIESTRFASTYGYDKLRSMKKLSSRGEAGEFLSEAFDCPNKKREALISLSFAYMFEFQSDIILGELLDLPKEDYLVEYQNLQRMRELARAYN